MAALGACVAALAASAGTVACNHGAPVVPATSAAAPAAPSAAAGSVAPEPPAAASVTPSASATPSATSSGAPTTTAGSSAPGRAPVTGSVPLGSARLAYRLPGVWKAKPPEKTGQVRVWGFERQVIDDADGRHVIPYIAIIVEELGEPTDVVMYSFKARLRAPFSVDRVFSWEDEPTLQVKNAIGYDGHVTYDDGLLHRLVILQGVQGLFGIQILCDATDSVDATTRPECFEFLGSLQITGPGAAGP